jgi:hypothetical protein
LEKNKSKEHGASTKCSHQQAVVVRSRNGLEDPMQWSALALQNLEVEFEV